MKKQSKPSKPSKPSASKNGNGLSSFRPATENTNRHTPYGLALLDQAMSEVGFVAPITVAADGESIDGSARLETAAIRFGDVDPIIIEHDGTRPIIAKRTDIPNAHTPMAKRIAVAANEIAHVDYALDADMIAALYANERSVLAGLMSDSRIDEILRRQGAVVDNALEDYKGMPEFSQADVLGSAIAIIVRFLSNDDIETFSKLIGQLVTPQTKSIWYPNQDAKFNRGGKGLVFSDES